MGYVSNYIDRYLYLKPKVTSVVMVHATANLVSPVAQTCSMHKRHSKIRVLQIFFSVSCALFLFAITGNMDSDSTQNPTFLCGK